MTRARALRILAVVAWLAAVWPLSGAFGQTAETNLEKYGWWNANQALPADPSGGLLPPVTVPPPPGAPEDGLYVEATVDGSARAIAGVTYYTGGGVDSSLTLVLSDGAPADGVTLAACPAGGGWDAVQNGRWDHQPTFDPAACTFLGAHDRDTITFTIPVTAHEPGSSYLSVAIVPAEGSGAFTASFKKPTNASLKTTPAATGAAPSPSPAPIYEPGPVTFGGPAFEAPADEGTYGSPTVTTTPGKKPTKSAAKPRPVVSTDDGNGQRIAAGLLFVIIGAGLWFLAVQEQRAPRLLGSVGRASE